jgi:hypothetical protein
MSDDFYCGVMAALGVIYQAGEETLAEEIVAAVGASSLLRVAKREDDVWLPDLKATVRFLARRKTLRASA